MKKIIFILSTLISFASFSQNTTPKVRRDNSVPSATSAVISAGTDSATVITPFGLFASDYCRTTGFTLTGALILAADPTTDLGAATKRYVDSKAGAYVPLSGNFNNINITSGHSPITNNIIVDSTQFFIELNNSTYTNQLIISNDNSYFSTSGSQGDGKVFSGGGNSGINYTDIHGNRSYLLSTGKTIDLVSADSITLTSPKIDIIGTLYNNGSPISGFSTLVTTGTWPASTTGTTLTIPSTIPWANITGEPTFLTAANNLNDVANAATARTNLGAENVANKATNFSTINNTLYPTVQAVNNAIAAIPKDSSFVTIKTDSIKAIGSSLKIIGTTFITGALQTTGNINAVGGITAANLSGTNTGDQTISMTGDVSGSGTGAITTTVNWANGESTYDTRYPTKTSVNAAISSTDSLFAYYQPYGYEAYHKSYWASLTDFTQSGTTASVTTSNSILFTGGSNTWTNYLTVNNTINIDENIEMEVTYLATSVSGFGLQIGRLVTQTACVINASAAYDLQNNNVQVYLPGCCGLGSAQTSGFTVAANDVCKLKYTQSGQYVISTFTDVTQGFSVATTFHDYSTNSPPTGQMAIWNYGGSVSITDIKITSKTNARPLVLCVGDSKMQRGSGIYAERFTTHLNSLGVISNYNGQCAITNDIVTSAPFLTANFKPKYVLLNIGRNDLAFGVSSATWQANYANAVNQYTAAGITVIHLLPIPEPTVDQSSLKTWITSNYSNYIDPSVGWVDAIHLYSDSIHPSDAGARFIANKVITSGKITPAIGYENENLQNTFKYFPRINQINTFQFPQNFTTVNLASGSAPTVTGQLANVSGTVEFYNGVLNKLAMQTTATGTANQLGIYNSSGQIVPTTASGDVTNSAGVFTIASAAVTYAKIQNVAATKLLGNSTGSAAAPQEITLGTNLSFSGTTLNATGSGSSITLTTTGSSGASTLVGTTLNVPTYTLAGLGGFANPMTAAGDIIYGGTSGAATRLVIGSSNNLLGVSSGNPVWGSPSTWGLPTLSASNTFTGTNLFSVNGPAAGVASIENTSSTGYTSIGFMDNTGTPQGGFGYGNSGVAAPLTLATYVSANNTGGIVLNSNNSSSAIKSIINGSTAISATNTSVSIPLTTTSTSTTTGALTVSGGVGIAGAVNIGSTTKALNFSTSGTAGNGYVGFTTQTSAPATPASGTYLEYSSSGSPVWLFSSGFGLTHSASITANRTVTWPDASFTIAGLGLTNAFTGTNTFVTQSAGDNSTKAATTAYVNSAASPVILFNSTIPTIVAGAGAGTSPTVSITANGNNTYHEVNITMGTLPTAGGVLATVTLSTPCAHLTSPSFSASNGTSSLLSGTSMVYMDGSTSSAYVITSGTVSPPSGTYTFRVNCGCN